MRLGLHCFSLRVKLRSSLRDAEPGVRLREASWIAAALSQLYPGSRPLKIFLNARCSPHPLRLCVFALKHTHRRALTSRGITEKRQLSGRAIIPLLQAWRRKFVKARGHRRLLIGGRDNAF